MIEQICTDRLIMRRFNKNDYNDAYEYLSDPDVMEYIEPPFSYEKTVKFIDSFAIEKPRIYALVEKAGGKVIGHVIFHPYEYNNVYELGWILNKNYQGKGYASEISSALIKHSFEKLNLHRIFATAAADNVNSCNLLKKLNMHEEAVFRKANFYKGKWIDECWFAMLEEDFLYSRQAQI